MAGTNSSGMGSMETKAVTSPVSASSTNPPTLKLLELQLDQNVRTISPMPNFSSQPSQRKESPPPRTSSLPIEKGRKRSSSAPMLVRSITVPNVSNIPEVPKIPVTLEKEFPKTRAAPTSKLEAEIYDLDDEEEADDDKIDEIVREVLDEKEVVSLRSQSYYAHAGAVLLADTLEVPPPVPLKTRSTMPTQANSRLPEVPPLPELVEITRPKTADGNRSDRASGRVTPSTMLKLSTQFPIPPSRSPSTKFSPVSPVEIGGREKPALRHKASLNAHMARTSSTLSSHSTRHSHKPRRSLEPKSPASPQSTTRSRADSAAKTMTTMTTIDSSKHNSTASCMSMESIASETSFSSINSGLAIHSEKFIRTDDTDFEILQPTIFKRPISRSATMPIPVDIPIAIPIKALPPTSRTAKAMPRAHIRPQLTTSRSTEFFTPEQRVPRPIAKRSKTVYEGHAKVSEQISPKSSLRSPTSSALSPQLEQTGGMGWGQVIKGSPTLVNVGDKERKRSDPKIEARATPEPTEPETAMTLERKTEERWGRGLGVEWGVAY